MVVWTSCIKQWIFYLLLLTRIMLSFWCQYHSLIWINIQLRADAMVHLKYWFRISSILERTKSSTKTSNTSFKRSDSGLLKSWRLGAWHSYWPAMPTLYDKLFRRRGCGKPMILPRPCPPGKLLSTIRAFNWYIVCLCTFFTFSVNWVQISKS